MSHILYSRRRWIQSVGLGLSAPLFSPLLRSTFAQGAGVIPRRFVIVLAGNGIESANLLSPATQAVIESQGTGSLDGQRYNFHTRYGHSNPIVNRVADLHLAPALSALNGGADLMDLREKAAVLYGLSNKVAGGGHSAGYGALSASAGRGSSPTSMTIEAWLARSLSGRSAYPFDAVRLGVVQSPTQRLQYGLCGRESGKAAPIIVDPHVAYSSLFGSVASADGRRAFDDRSDLLSFARSDVRRVLAAFSGSSRERQKLEVYLESLETLQRRQTRLQDAEGTLEQVRPADPNEDARFASPHPLERLAVQFDLATAALVGGLTPVVLLTSGAKDFDLSYTSLESIFREDPNFQAVKGRHFVCHNSGGNPAYLKVLNRVTERHVELMATMARTLDRVPEGDGTMLDNTAILYISDNGDQHHSPSTEWPALVIGGGALGLQTDGRSIVYPKLGEANHRQVSNLYNTLGWASGQALDDFGGEGATRVAPGPLPELFS